MDKNVHEQRLPQITLVLSPSSTEDDARAVASDMISNGLDIERFEILHIEMMEEGTIQTKNGMIKGRRYVVAFRQLYGEVIFTHPDFDKIMDQVR